MRKIKTIKLNQIAKILNLSLDIFEEQDNYYPDNRIIKKKEKAIESILNKITSNKEEQKLIYDNIEKEMFNSNDFTFKPICNNLRAIGYTIIEGK